MQDLRYLSSVSQSSSLQDAGATLPLESSDAEDEVLPTSVPASFVTSTPAGGYLASRTPTMTSGRRSGAGALTGKRGGHVHFHARASKAVFALCFSESILLFVLVLCQSVDVLSER